METGTYNNSRIEGPASTCYRPVTRPWRSTYHDHLCRCEGCAHPENLYHEEPAEERGIPCEARALKRISLIMHRERETVDLVDEAGKYTQFEIPLTACNSALRLVESSLLHKWTLSYSQDPRARQLADRHYSRLFSGSPGTPRFVAPGKCLVLLDDLATALWVTLWQQPQYTRHRWAGAWVCALFRNESYWRSSDLITEAIAHTRFMWGEPPEQGCVTFIDPQRVRRKRDWGRCYRRAGWHSAGSTKGGLIVLQLLPEDMPAPCAPRLPLLYPPWLREKFLEVVQKRERRHYGKGSHL
jgi:hypothetical protein